MDRLLCGDVGYGKTEVALRAAFKASLDGKQVMVLVPTTILAQQHYGTFRERFADYPVKVEMISRFRSAAEQRRILTDFAAGSVDVLIGTHRLLQPGREAQGPGSGHRGRGAALRRGSEGGLASPQSPGGRAHAHCHAHPAHPADVALGSARHHRHRDAAPRPPSHPDLRGSLRRRHGHARHRAGDRARRPGLLSSQPGGDHRQGGHAAACSDASSTLRRWLTVSCPNRSWSGSCLGSCAATPTCW